MLRSMTGFGSARNQVGTEEISVELRSVNGKFCEVKGRLPRELASLEADAVRNIKGRLSRGTIDLGVRRQASAKSTLTPRIDGDLAEGLAAQLRALRDALGLEGELRLSELVSVEGVVTLEERPPDLDDASAALLAALDEALIHLISMREREGEALEADLLERIAKIEAHAAVLMEQAPLAVQDQQERIRRRVEELTDGIPLDPQRLAQEVALLAERSDIAEELTRLGSHVAQFRELVASDQPVGRRLDFLTQELNREVNTIASKASWAGAASITVELKAELERIREQVQNVE